MNQFLLTLFSLHFLNDGIRTATIALLPFVSKEFHLTYTQVGFLGSSQGVLTSVLAFPAGFLAGRVGGYRLILLSLLVYSLGTLLIGFSPNTAILIISFYLSAIGFAAFHVVGFALVSRMSKKNNIGRNLGNFTAIGDVGRVVLPALAIFTVPIIGWRHTYLITALLGIFFFGIIQIFSRKKFADKQILTNKNETRNEWIKQAAILFKAKKLLLIIVAGVIDGLAGSPIYIFLPFLLLHKGVSVTMLAIFSGVYFAGSLFGKSALGRGVDKFGNAKVFIVAEFLMAFSLIILAFSQQLFLLLILAFLLGLFTRGTTPVLTTLFSEVTQADHYEKVFAISETFLGITAAIAPTAMGVIADRAGITAVFYCAASLALIASLPIFFVTHDSSTR